MSKCLNELTFEDIIKSQASEECDDFIADLVCYEGIDRFDKDDVDELTSREEKECVDEWREKFDVEDFIDRLKENKDFKDKIVEIVEKF